MQEAVECSNHEPPVWPSEMSKYILIHAVMRLLKVLGRNLGG